MDTKFKQALLLNDHNREDYVALLEVAVSEDVMNGVIINYSSYLRDLDVIKKNNLKAMKFLVEKGGKICDFSVEFAVFYGHLEMVKFLIENGGSFGELALYYATKNRHFEIVKFLVENGGNSSEKAVDYTIKNWHFVNNEHFEVAKFLVQTDVKMYGKLKQVLLDDYSKENYVALLEAAASEDTANGVIMDYSSYLVDAYIMATGNLKGVKFLIEKGGRIDDFSIYLASRNGHSEIVKFLVENSGGSSEEAIYYAVIHGHSELAEFLMQKGLNEYPDIEMVYMVGVGVLLSGLIYGLASDVIDHLLM